MYSIKPWWMPSWCWLIGHQVEESRLKLVRKATVDGELDCYSGHCMYCGRVGFRWTRP